MKRKQLLLRTSIVLVLSGLVSVLISPNSPLGRAA